MLTAIQIRVEDAALVADEDAAAMTNLANRPISEVLRRMLTSKQAVTTLPHPPRVARDATNGSKIARRDRQNGQIEIQLPSSQQTMRPMSRLNNRLNAARNLLVVQLVVAMLVVAMLVVAMVVVAEATTAAIADAGAADNEVRLAAMETNPAEAENLGAKSPNSAKPATPRNNAQPANRLQSTMTEMTLSILEMTPAKIPLATKTLRPGTKPSARSSTEI
jgi:hypothetical protein